MQHNIQWTLFNTADRTGYGHSLLHSQLCIYEPVQIKDF